MLAAQGDRRRRQAGFTLLELLVVVIILAALAALVGPRLFGTLGKAKSQVAKTQISILASSMDRYRLDVGRYPTTEEGLEALVTQPSGVAGWNGPYIKKSVPLDPWGREYVYRCPGENGEFDIVSLGADGQSGGTGEDADVTN